MTVNHFHTLNLEPAFVLDSTALQQAYVQAQQQFHPDRQSGKSDAEKQQAALASAAANDAYRVLKDDQLRAVHLLELQDIKIHGDDATTKPAPELLMEVMEWNEQGDQVSGSEAASLLGEWQATQQKLLNELAESFTAHSYKTAAQQVLRLGYLEKAIRNLSLKVKAQAA